MAQTGIIPETPAAVLEEFAANCVTWQAQALMRAAAAKRRGDHDQFRYEDGHASAFEVCALMARMRAEAFQ